MKAANRNKKNNEKITPLTCLFWIGFAAHAKGNSLNLRHLYRPKDSRRQRNGSRPSWIGPFSKHGSDVTFAGSCFVLHAVNLDVEMNKGHFQSSKNRFDRYANTWPKRTSFYSHSHALELNLPTYRPTLDVGQNQGIVFCGEGFS